MKDIEIVVFNDKSWVRLAEYQELIEKMKCCGNCSKWYDCSKEKQMLFKLHKNCVDWELAE